MAKRTKPEKQEAEQCMCCTNPGKYRIGLPGQRVHLCGVHMNQLRKMFPPFTYFTGLTRREIRAAFGFLVLEA